MQQWMFSTVSPLSILSKRKMTLFTRPRVSCFWNWLLTLFGHQCLIHPWRNVDVNAMDAKNGTALLRASQHCQLEALQLLLDHGSAVDQMVLPLVNFADVNGTLFQPDVFLEDDEDDEDDEDVKARPVRKSQRKRLVGGGFFGDEYSMLFGRWLGDLYVAQRVFSVFSVLCFPRCWVTPLVFAIASQDTRTCGGERQLDVIRMLLKNGAKLSYQAPWQIWDSFNHFNCWMRSLFYSLLSNSSMRMSRWRKCQNVKWKSNITPMLHLPRKSESPTYITTMFHLPRKSESPTYITTILHLPPASKRPTSPKCCTCHPQATDQHHPNIATCHAKVKVQHHPNVAPATQKWKSNIHHHNVSLATQKWKSNIHHHNVAPATRKQKTNITQMLHLPPAQATDQHHPNIAPCHVQVKVQHHPHVAPATQKWKSNILLYDCLLCYVPECTTPCFSIFTLRCSSCIGSFSAKFRLMIMLIRGPIFATLRDFHTTGAGVWGVGHHAKVVIWSVSTNFAGKHSFIQTPTRSIKLWSQYCSWKPLHFSEFVSFRWPEAQYPP